MTAAQRPGMLRLQVNTTGAWRNVIEFPRDDDIICAQVLTAAPLLAAAAGPRATLRICSADGLQTVQSHWQAGQGWRPARAAADGDAS
ncbi:MAG: hypothetical protein JNL87_09290 [Burkholderiaceae bacterium]|nr:hypothetical protein [Burkholderiaceae bacterium]